jgi:hypothetical protein
MDLDGSKGGTRWRRARAHTPRPRSVHHIMTAGASTHTGGSPGRDTVALRQPLLATGSPGSTRGCPLYAGQPPRRYPTLRMGARPRCVPRFSACPQHNTWLDQGLAYCFFIPRGAAICTGPHSRCWHRGVRGVCWVVRGGAPTGAGAAGLGEEGRRKQHKVARDKACAPAANANGGQGACDSRRRRYSCPRETRGGDGRVEAGKGSQPWGPLAGGGQGQRRLHAAFHQTPSQAKSLDCRAELCSLLDGSSQAAAAGGTAGHVRPTRAGPS